jgi:hypothetical protein
VCVPLTARSTEKPWYAEKIMYGVSIRLTKIYTYSGVSFCFWFLDFILSFNIYLRAL